MNYPYSCFWLAFGNSRSLTSIQVKNRIARSRQQDRLKSIDPITFPAVVLDQSLKTLPYELSQPFDLIAGVDEVGRGALFGIVVTAAVILPKDAIDRCQSWGIKDSKKLSARRRELLVPQIQQIAIAYQIGIATVAEIDDLNILQATLVAMRRAVTGLSVTPELCLVDGNRAIPQLEVPQQTLVKGEDRSISIAAASILAKVWRDRVTCELAEIYPLYDLASNKGYGTARHRSAIEKYGITPEHRQSFSPCNLHVSHPLSTLVASNC